MSCEHEFRPWPGSRLRVYCPYCGVGREAFAPLPAPRRAPSRRARATGSAQTETPPTLFGTDPDIDAARDVVADRRARADVGQRVRSIAESSGLGEDEVDELVRQANDFGPDLDLDAFATQIVAMGERQPPFFADPSE